MEPQDDSRTNLLKKKSMSKSEKPLERELEEISFEVNKVLYLRECAIELFESYSTYLTQAERLAARFYLLKAYIFYSEPLTRDLQNGKMPAQLGDIDISQQKFSECTNSEFYKNLLDNLKEENMNSELMYEDTYNLLQTVIQHMPIKNF